MIRYVKGTAPPAVAESGRGGPWSDRKDGRCERSGWSRSCCCWFRHARCGPPRARVRRRPPRPHRSRRARRRRGRVPIRSRRRCRSCRVLPSRSSTAAPRAPKPCCRRRSRERSSSRAAAARCTSRPTVRRSSPSTRAPGASAGMRTTSRATPRPPRTRCCSPTRTSRRARLQRARRRRARRRPARRRAMRSSSPRPTAAGSTRSRATGRGRRARVLLRIPREPGPRGVVRGVRWRTGRRLWSNAGNANVGRPPPALVGATLLQSFWESGAILVNAMHAFDVVTGRELWRRGYGPRPLGTGPGVVYLDTTWFPLQLDDYVPLGVGTVDLATGTLLREYYYKPDRARNWPRRANTPFGATGAHVGGGFVTFEVDGAWYRYDADRDPNAAHAVRLDGIDDVATWFTATRALVTANGTNRAGALAARPHRAAAAGRRCLARAGRGRRRRHAVRRRRHPAAGVRPRRHSGARARRGAVRHRHRRDRAPSRRRGTLPGRARGRRRAADRLHRSRRAACGRAAAPAAATARALRALGHARARAARRAVLVRPAVVAVVDRRRTERGARDRLDARRRGRPGRRDRPGHRARRGRPGTAARARRSGAPARRRRRRARNDLVQRRLGVHRESLRPDGTLRRCRSARCRTRRRRPAPS